VGDAQQSGANGNLKMPDLKPGKDGFRVRYDCVTNGGGIYIVYDNHRAYPSYLITFWVSLLVFMGNKSIKNWKQVALVRIVFGSFIGDSVASSCRSKEGEPDQQENKGQSRGVNGKEVHNCGVVLDDEERKLHDPNHAQKGKNKGEKDDAKLQEENPHSKHYWPKEKQGYESELSKVENVIEDRCDNWQETWEHVHKENLG